MCHTLPVSCVASLPSTLNINTASSRRSNGTCKIPENLYVSGSQTNLIEYSFGGQRSLEERLQVMIGSAGSMNHQRQREYWQKLGGFVQALKGTSLKPIKPENLAATLAVFGISPVTWEDWSKLLKRARGCLAAQQQKRSNGRRYTAAASQAEQLALFMCFGDVDGLTGEPLPVEKRFLDAYVQALPHK